MLSMVRIDGVEYYQKLARTEYYVGKAIDETSDQSQPNDHIGEPAGMWGKGVEWIGITNETVNATVLQQVMSGYRPSSKTGKQGKKLVQSAGTIAHRVGMDLTFSAPKSLSVIWASGEHNLRNEISKIQREAVAEAMDYLRERTTTRRNKGGNRVDPVKALIYATFEHCNTREDDPQIHTHTVLSNACIRYDGTTGAINNEAIYLHKLAAGAVYRAALCKRLRILGFAMEADTNSPDLFKVAGVSETIQKHFSKRSIEIYGIAAVKGITSAKALGKIAINTRPKKGVVDRAELFKDWQEQSADLGFTAKSVAAAKTLTVPVYELPSFEAMIETLTEHENTFLLRDIERLLATHGQFLDFDRDTLKDELLKSNDCVELCINGARQYTSQTLINLENTIITQARVKAQETVQRLNPETVAQQISKTETDEGYTLRQEQRDAVQHLCAESGGIALLKGLAGTGKTTALKTVVNAFKSQGFTVLGATISAKAAAVLSRETGLNGTTVAKILVDLEARKTTLTAKTVLILDEAGMIGSRDFYKLQKYTAQARAKLILVGDERQLQSIAVGGIFNALQVHGEIKSSDLTNITRQADKRDLEASKLFSEGKANQALAIYEAKGQIKTHYTRDKLFELIADDFLADDNALKDKAVITSTKGEGVTVNNAIRERLKKTGKLDASRAAYFENANGHLLEICQGDRIIFKRNCKALGLQNNLNATVTDFRTTRNGDYVLSVKTDDGKVLQVKTKDYTDIRHGFAITGHSSQGETLKSTYVLYNRGIADFSWGYVAMTRHKQSVNLYATNEDKPHLAESFSKANFKNTTQDLAAYRANTKSQDAERSSVGASPTFITNLREVYNISELDK
jgi:conjugative relaxase-like TrwC/TraI family protein